MIREAEIYVAADEVATGVYAQVRADQWDALLPPVFDMPGADQPLPLRQVANHYAYDNSWVPDMLAGRTMDDVGRDAYDGDLLGDDPAESLRRISAAARVAAREVDDPTAVVHCSYGDVPTDDYLWQLNIARCLSALDIAALLGLPNPISEDLARGMIEGTAPTADVWRSFGVYREQVPVAEDAPWVDRYLALTGRQSWKGPTRAGAGA